MSNIPEHEARIPSNPLKMVGEALDAAGKQKPYYASFGSEEGFRNALMRSLNLDTDIPDGRTLMERFVPKSGFISSILSIRPLIDNSRGLTQLLGLTQANQANEFQESLAATLAKVGIRQFEREGAICPFATQLVMMAPDRFLTNSPRLRERLFEEVLAKMARETGANEIDVEKATSIVLSDLGLTPSKRVATKEISIYISSPDGQSKLRKVEGGKKIPPEIVRQIIPQMLGIIISHPELLYIQKGKGEINPLFPPQLRRGRTSH